MTKDGVDQVTAALRGRQGLTSIQFLTYGQPGALELGSSGVTAASLSSRAAEVASWGDHLAPGADIEFWGCNVAQGSTGQAFVDTVHTLTGATVGASTDATGAAALGGNWVLEDTTGPLHGAVFSDTAMAAYNDILDSAVATSLGIIGEANNTNGGGTGLYGTAVSSVNATVGDPIRYSAVVQLSEGQQNDLQLTVNLPNGMTFLNDGSITIELVSPDGSIIAVDFGSAASASYGSASFNPNTAKATFQLPANQITANPDGTVTFDLAQVNDNRAVIDGSMCSAWSPLRATSPPNWPAQPSPPSPSSVRCTRARRKDALNDRMR